MKRCSSRVRAIFLKSVSAGIDKEPLVLPSTKLELVSKMKR